MAVTPSDHYNAVVLGKYCVTLSHVGFFQRKSQVEMKQHGIIGRGQAWGKSKYKIPGFWDIGRHQAIGTEVTNRIIWKD